MKKINYVKFALDLVMGLLFVLFFNKNVFGGLKFHEIAGLVFAGAYITHILLNWGWVKRVTLKMFDRRLSWRVRGSYALNFLLMVSMTFIIVSGILISHVLFPNLNVGNENWFKMTHISVSFLVLALIGIHVGLHWQWVVNMCEKMTSVKKSRAWMRYVAQGLTLIILLFGLYQINQTSYVTQLKSSVSVFGMNTQQSGFEGKGAFKGGEQGGTREGRPSGGGGQSGFDRGGKGGNVSFVSVILTYTGIMGVFVIVAYYLKKLSVYRKRKTVANPN
ncbi:DUF4405 domain-containing protein [Paenibacillus sp. 19GGS1-52]|uniref:DUF4405 domain-containing protein n=1 Tax=Paenibacillus sp. 19GGS1-52 TaxID=2758563 RepID=UPI001EFACD12|nr:DUF4405 domain-containing protein [Paenibacillus sp. 19GGS1-52]ULO07657.1 DUF4405 domain-containing protein [Paenibacillus sp. 19GGS1-52]